jgi:hypothetical protein
VAAYDLRAIREQWGDLLAAIEQAPAAEWPPREARGFLDQLATDDHAAVSAVGRMPLVLREHPAPLNLDALAAAVDVELDLFGLADTVAAEVQRPVRRVPVPVISQRTRRISEPMDRAAPARWTYASSIDPGSRAYGLHWAAVWIEGRTLGEQSDDLFRPVRPLLLDEIAAVARHARQTIERALGRDGRPTALDRPCPYCRGRLTAYTRSGDPAAATIVCATGEPCPGPVLLNARGRREWAGADLVGLYVAMEAAQHKTGGTPIPTA